MKKIIITSVSICVVCVIAISTLILALVSVNTNKLIERPDEIYIMNKITKDNGNGSPYKLESGDENESKKIDDLYSVFNSCFGQKALLALFRGELYDKMVTEHYNSYSSRPSVSRNESSTDKFTIVFKYYSNNTQTYKYGNGESYSYNYLFFEIDNSDIKKEVMFGVIDSVDPYTAYSFSSQYTYEAKINSSALYNYICSLSYFADNM